MDAALSSASEVAVALAKFPSCRAAAWSPTVGTAAFAAATILPAGWGGGREGKGKEREERGSVGWEGREGGRGGGRGGKEGEESG